MVKQSNPRKKCIFCQEQKSMSKEHIWGDWLKAYITQTMNKHRFRTERINRPGIAPTRNMVLKAGDPLRSKVRVVCVDCNSQWLSRIQKCSKHFLVPLIKGEPTVLGKDAQQQVAAWCAMATMTAEFIDRDPNTVAVPQSDRDWLQNNGTAPTGWRIWIAHYQRHRWSAQWVHFTLPILAAKDMSDQPTADFDPPNTQTTTFVVGNLYVHVMSSVDPDNISNFATSLSLDFPLLVGLFPQKASVIAWPPKGMSDRDADAVASAFQKHADGITRSLLGRRLV